MPKAILYVYTSLVRPLQCLSVTLLHCVKTAKYIIKLFHYVITP